MTLIEYKTLRPVAKPRREIYYPTSDGEPIGESDLHRDVTVYLIEGLKAFYADRTADVYVSGDNFIYYARNMPSKVVSPDVYVVFGVEHRQRDTFMTWKEGGRLPSVVIEISSRSTERIDVGRKMDLYAKTLKVAEYFLFDPKLEYLDPPLAGFRLVNGEYVPIPLINGRMYSEQLKLELVIAGNRLRLYDPAKGEFLLSLDEQRQRADAAANRAAAAAERAASAADRAAAEAERADAAAIRAAAEADRADSEAQARLVAEAEITDLRAQLEALRRAAVNDA